MLAVISHLGCPHEPPRRFGHDSAPDHLPISPTRLEADQNTHTEQRPAREAAPEPIDGYFTWLG